MTIIRRFTIFMAFVLVIWIAYICTYEPERRLLVSKTVIKKFYDIDNFESERRLVLIPNKTLVSRYEHTLDIVVARYKEPDECKFLIDLFTSVNNTQIRCIIYNKGGYQGGNTLPNVGRETHTYFTHIINNYHSLADVTVFVPGSFHTSKVKFDQLHIVADYIKQHGIHPSCYIDQPRGYLKDHLHFTLDYWLSMGNEANTNASKDQPFSRSPIQPLGKWINETIRKPYTDKRTSLSCLYGVGRNNILSNPINEYKRWVSLLEECGPNGEILHYFERSMYVVFE